MADVKIYWYGHAMFMISRPGMRIITDPYSIDIGFSFPELDAEVVLVSHDHYDHNNTRALGGRYRVIKDPEPMMVGPASFEGLTTYHDPHEGEKRGNNIIFRWEMDGLTFVHMGDYGEDVLTKEQKRFMEGADILMIPVGGVYTIDGEKARQVVSKVSPSVVIPMHYKIPNLKLGIEKIDPFLEGLDRVKRIGNMAEVSANNLPDKTEIWIMDKS